MSELRYILAAVVFAMAASVVADQADRSATPAPAKADHSLPGLAVAARAGPVSADSGHPAEPAAATAAAAALEMTFELGEPRREPLVVRLPVAPGEPFRKLTMDGAESYTICGELTDLGEGRFELTVTICHWRTPQVRPTFTTTLQLTANTPCAWVRFPGAAEYRQTVTIVDPSQPAPHAPQDDDQANADSADADQADRPDPDDVAVTEALPGASEAWRVATEIAPQTDTEPDDKLTYVSPWSKLIIPLADSDKRLEVKINFVIEEKDWADMQDLLCSQQDALRADIESYLMGQDSDDLYGGEDLDRVSRTVLEISNRHLFGEQPGLIREVLFTEYTIH